MEYTTHEDERETLEFHQLGLDPANRNVEYPGTQTGNLGIQPSMNTPEVTTMTFNAYAGTLKRPTSFRPIDMKSYSSTGSLR